MPVPREPAPAAIVFDVNETLLDLGALDPLFEEVLGDAQARRDWFATLLRTALTATILDAYRTFGDLGRDALRAVASGRAVDVAPADLDRILMAIGELPAHPDAEPALEALADAGFRLAALTNSAPDLAERQLTSAGLRDRFEAVLSVDSVRRFKPARATYLHAAEALDEAPGRLLMVAAHDWDLRGAAAAGLRIAYVERPGMSFVPPEERPELSGRDLRALAERILVESAASG